MLRYPVYGAGWRFFDLRRYGRDHRKILVVDDTVGFVGGYNIGSAYETEWRDTHVQVTGPGVWDLRRAFADFWNLHRRRRIGTSERPLLLETASTWEPRIRFQRNVPRLWMFPIRAMYLEAINRASVNIWMTQAYFLPDQDFVDALKDAAKRGVDVRILLPLKSNHIVADWISRGYFSQLLDAGVRILRFKDAMVHAKTATVDGTWTTVGTANIDRLSLTGNYEINVEVIDEDLAQLLEEIWSARRVELHRADVRRVGGPGPAPAVHRVRAAAAAAVALTARPLEEIPRQAGRCVRGAMRGPRRGCRSPASTTSITTRLRCGRQGSRYAASSASSNGAPGQREAHRLRDVVVAEGDCVRVAERPLTHLGAGPHADPRERPQPSVGLLGREPGGSLERLGDPGGRDDRPRARRVDVHPQPLPGRDGAAAAPAPAGPRASGRRPDRARARRTGARAAGSPRTPPAR